ncbi:hypothetical protein ILUMI_18755, partial [Ignelater luminosus]
ALYTWEHEYRFLDLSKPTVRTGITCLVPAPRYENPIETVWDLAGSGLNWGATQDAWIFSILDEKRPQYVTIVDRFVATSSENLIERSETNHFAFSIERLPSGQFAIGSYVTEETVKKLRLMHEDLYWEYCLFMLPKSSFLLESVDDFTLRVFQAGLVIIWEKAAAEVHMDLRVQNIVKYYFYANKKKQEDTVKLKWVHVEGVFGILVIGLGLAGVCFITEMIVHKCNNQKLAFGM